MSTPHPALKTRDLPSPILSSVVPSESLQEALRQHFNPLQTTHPGMLYFAKSKQQGIFLQLNNEWHLDEFIGDVPFRSGKFSAKVRNSKLETKDISGYCKILHVLDAYRMLEGEYPMSQHPALPCPGSKSVKVFAKLHDPHNQAYVDSNACYMLSKFREGGHSPHFSHFYGSYLGIAKKYYYNISEDFSELRTKSWFWKQLQKGHFTLVGYYKNVLLPKDSPVFKTPEYLYDSDSEDSVESLHEFSCEPQIPSEELESLATASIDTESSHSTETSVTSNFSEILDDDTQIFAVIDQFPTLLMFLETNTDTLDSLLYNHERHGTEAWESEWTAWLFQIIAALCQIQSLWGMTHNDLHSNNILWTETEETHLYYSSLDGRVWKVPTYGKIFRIIDFGRAIYTHNNVTCISDDYYMENDAGSQYNFGPIYNSEYPTMHPNPSFDLSRLAVSILEGIFLEIPEEKEDGVILSQELDRTQKETPSELYNLLWSWLIDCNGRNVLWDADGSERYPGFDLYTVIAQKVKTAVPRDQLDKSIFQKFQANANDILDGMKVYSLFC